MATKNQRVIPRFKTTPYTLSEVSNELKQPTLLPVKITNNVQLCSTPDLPNNKRGFKYTPCRPNPYLDSSLYSTTDIPPYGVHWSYFDRSPEMYVNDKMNIIGANDNDGWRSSRTNIGIKEGKWYIEYKILNGIKDENLNNDIGEQDNVNSVESSILSRSVTPMPIENSNFKGRNLSPHVRIGIGRKEAALEAPVGFDGYSYGLRDINCEKIHLSRRTALCPDQDLKIGDIIGFLIELPSMKVQKEIARLMIIQKTLSDPVYSEDMDIDDYNHRDNEALENSFLYKGVIRDMIPIKYKNELFFENLEYTKSNRMEHLLNPVTVFGEHAVPDTERFQPAKLPNSSITVFVNGVNKGKAFENLSAFLPPASEKREARKTDKKKPDDLVVENDDGELGYYPMASCFRGGAIEINTTKNIWMIPQDLKEGINSKDIKPYGERAKFKIVDEYVEDIFDNTVNLYLDRKELEISTQNQNL